MKDLQFAVHKFLKDRGWDNLRPSDLAKSISIEAAELLELFQWDNPTLAETKESGRMEKIKKELADVMIYSIQMAVLLDIDPKEIINVKLARAIEKYPAELIKHKEGIDPGTEETYWKIKEDYRKQGLS